MDEVLILFYFFLSWNKSDERLLVYCLQKCNMPYTANSPHHVFLENDQVTSGDTDFVITVASVDPVDPSHMLILYKNGQINMLGGPGGKYLL